MWCPWTRPCHPRSVFHYCFILSFLLLSFPPFLLSSCFPILHSSFLSYFISFSLLLFRFLSHFVLICFPFLFFFQFLVIFYSFLSSFFGGLWILISVVLFSVFLSFSLFVFLFQLCNIRFSIWFLPVFFCLFLIICKCFVSLFFSLLFVSDFYPTNPHSFSFLVTVFISFPYFIFLHFFSKVFLIV